jgi:hypothetical protein
LSLANVNIPSRSNSGDVKMAHKMGPKSTPGQLQGVVYRKLS